MAEEQWVGLWGPRVCQAWAIMGENLASWVGSQVLGSRGWVELLPWMPCRLTSVQLTTESLEEPWQGPELESLAGPSAR